MRIKTIIKKVLLEDIAKTASVAGSDAETALTRAEYLRDKAMQNLSDLGVYGAKGHMASLGIFDDDYLSKSGPFGFKFTTKDGKETSGMAKYDKSLSKKENSIVLSFKSEEPVCFEEDCYQYFKIKFSPESTRRAYLQTVKRKIPKFWKKVEKTTNLRGLQEGYVFDVTIIPYGKSSSGDKFLKKQRYGKSFKKGLAGQQTKANLTGQAPGQSGQQSLQFPEGYENPNQLLFEAQGDIVNTQIKIIKIGIKKPTTSEYDDDEDSELDEKNFTKVQGTIKLPKEVENLFNQVALDKISDYLKKGIFYAKISEKTKNSIILSDSPRYDSNSEYVVLQSKVGLDTSNPLSWKGKVVKVGKNAMGRDEFPSNIEGTIGNLKVIK